MVKCKKAWGDFKWVDSTNTEIDPTRVKDRHGWITFMPDHAICSGCSGTISYSRSFPTNACVHLSLDSLHAKVKNSEDPAVVQ